MTDDKLNENCEHILTHIFRYVDEPKNYPLIAEQLVYQLRIPLDEVKAALDDLWLDGYVYKNGTEIANSYRLSASGSQSATDIRNTKNKTHDSYNSIIDFLDERKRNKRSGKMVEYPVTAHQLERSLGITKDEVKGALDDLISNNRVFKSVIYNSESYAITHTGLQKERYGMTPAGFQKERTRQEQSKPGKTPAIHVNGWFLQSTVN